MSLCEVTPRSPVDGPRRQSEVMYQTHPRSFADSKSDGTGDLQGVLDPLAWLELGSMWLAPITISPIKDSDCDVSDYCDVDPAFGDLDLFDRLLAEAGRGDLVVVALVADDASSRHRRFIGALGGRSDHHRERYPWAEPDSDAEPPNNWVGTSAGPAWTSDEPSRQYCMVVNPPGRRRSHDCSRDGAIL